MAVQPTAAGTAGDGIAGGDTAGERMLSGLLDAAHRVSPDDLTDLVAEYAAIGDLTDPVIYLADVQRDLLIPLPSRRPARPLPVRGTLAGRVFTGPQVVMRRARPGGDGGGAAPQRWWLALLEGTEKIGVLALTVPPDPAAARRAHALASLVALVLVSKRACSDTMSRLVRRQPMSLAAEMQWALLPPRTFGTSEVAVTSSLEPAYEVGGDAFDYGMRGTHLHVSIFDAMGHDLDAGLTATIAVGACRRSRLEGHDLVRMAQSVDAAVERQFHGDRFVSGVFADLDTATGIFTWVNCGHPQPLLIRGGRRVRVLHGVSGVVMGIAANLGAPPVNRTQLEIGDRLLFYTDGVVEARHAVDDDFGVRRLGDLVLRRHADGLSAPETLRRLVGTVLDQRSGPLLDDATIVLVEWRSRHQAASWHSRVVERHRPRQLDVPVLGGGG
ncbi:MAG: serine/threonine-protein phosphatase [Micromonosporaceae bacterium]|nr:serine/threonine-protein phosphatase [Micromonosporaceae bacterium]